MKRAILAAIGFACILHAASTTIWEMNSSAEFIRGRFSNAALDTEGRLRLAPKLTPILTPDQAAIWCLAQAPDGSVYAGTGHRGKLYRIDRSGASSVVWTADQPEIFAVAIDKSGSVYAASSPDGKVYRIRNGKAEEFFAPKAKYIWSLAIAPDGSVFAGTGLPGKVYRIDVSGKSELYYDSGQSHVTSLAIDSEGRVLAGTEPNGILYRIDKPNRAFALYNSSLPEIRSIVPAADGSIYVAAMGGALLTRMGMQPATAAANPYSISVTASAAGAAAAEPPTGDAQSGAEVKPKTSAPNAPVTPAVVPTASTIETPGVERSALYQIHPDNTVDTLWTSKDENLYDIAAAKNGSLFLATDAQGRVYRFGKDHRAELIAQTNQAETTRLLHTANGLLAATGDSAKLFRLDSDHAASGSYEAPVHDAGTVARWGRVTFRVPEGSVGRIGFETRSGNSARPDTTWSDWSVPVADVANSRIQSPNARYIQWRAELSGANPGISDVTLSYLPQNQPPVARSISVNSTSQANATAKPSQSSSSATYSITVTDTGEPSASAQTVGRASTSLIQISWQADDPDNDKLVYNLYFRGEGEREWKLLKANLQENNFNLDGDALADGRYHFRVVASDRLSNDPKSAREAELVSSPILVDNTPPSVTIASHRRSGTDLDVEADAHDAVSPLRRCEYSIDAKPWTLVEAADGVTDSPSERFPIHIANLPPGEHVVVVRVYDAAGNAGLVKLVAR